MTIIIAQKIDNSISLSSDSRLSFRTGDNVFQHFDSCPKIFSIPLKIYEPIDSLTRNENLVYDNKIGLAVGGELKSSYIIKEHITEILQNLQYIPGQTDLSMASVANTVYKFYLKIFESLKPILYEDAICYLILAGYCPLQKSIRFFLFEVIRSQGTPNFREILLADGTESFGSGKSEADQLICQNSNLSPLHIIRKIIDLDTVESVGGGLQFGRFDRDNNFIVHGVENYSYEDGNLEFFQTLRGIDLYKNELELTDSDFFISYPLVTPFDDEIQQIGNDLTE